VVHSFRVSYRIGPRNPDQWQELSKAKRVENPLNKMKEHTARKRNCNFICNLRVNAKGQLALLLVLLHTNIYRIRKFDYEHIDTRKNPNRNHPIPKLCPCSRKTQEPPPPPPKAKKRYEIKHTDSGLPMMLATALLASLRMPDVTTPSRGTLVCTLRLGIAFSFYLPHLKLLSPFTSVISAHKNEYETSTIIPTQTKVKRLYCNKGEKQLHMHHSSPSHELVP
jgi:hypothetical protein